jgi:ammonia channel protein AmtB
MTITPTMAFTALFGAFYLGVLAGVILVGIFSGRERDDED